MNPAQSPLLKLNHLNRGLFSDYYLDNIVPTLPEWEDGELYAAAKTLREDLKALLATLKPESLDESQLEEQWVKPVLEKLGHYWSVQVKIRYRDRGYRKPDYVFAATLDEARAFTNQIYEPREVAHALALGDAKKWGANLDQASKDERNPSQQIDEYLRYSELRWGILTDGRFWRLYHRDSSQNNDYYAVDLPGLLQGDTIDDTHAFYYFFLFFRREAFIKDGWLDRVLQGSNDYAESLSDQLEDEVYNALELIAQGFLRYRRNRLKPDAATLKTIYEQSLVLLYRLLFVFYAESRDVLPMSDNEAYANSRSLKSINRDTAETMDIQYNRYWMKKRVDDSATYARLSALFFAIDSGDPEFNVSPYNGRLFSDEEHPFLGKNSIGDAYLVPALDRLARVPDRQHRSGRVFVDYRDLDVRHLGAIYEKLLEYQLDIAAEPLALRDGKYVPAQSGDKAVVEPGEVYLRTGNNERKITGSYYTPDYITRFIVERTLEPLLTEITTRYAALDMEGQWVVRDADGLRQDVLALNILDPATGSGHFMVEAVNYMAEWLRRLRLGPADIEPGEDELTYWKRQVVTACIYGVDANPLAVELARLSLWLTTAARGKPLSFLDHHVKVGNTLVGTRAAQIGANLETVSSVGAHRDAPASDSPAQLALFDESAFADSITGAVSLMAAVERIIADTVQQVKEQERSYEQLQDKLANWARLANLWTARHFGLNLTQVQWKTTYDALTKAQPLNAEAETLLKAADALAAEYRFFHWDLAFPEVFFGTDGKPQPNAGFDTVIGNPPYVRQERIQPYKPFLAARYEVYSGTADLFLYFYEQALKLVKPSHRVGYVTSGTFMNSNSAAEFRRFIHANAGFEAVVNFGENQPFKGAEMVYPTIAILKKDKPAPTFSSLFIDDVYRRDELGQAIVDLPMVETASDVTALDEWRFQSVELTRLFKKVTEGYQTLGQFIEGKIYSGIKTGLNEAFIIDDSVRNQLVSEDPLTAEIIKPMRRGQDLRPWYQTSSGLYLIWTYQGIEISRYPTVMKYLEQFHALLAKRSEPLSGQCEWYELRPCDYYDVFDRAKILWPDISKLPRFSRNEGYYLGNTAFVISSTNFSLLALLQSRPLWFAISQIAQPLRLRAGLWQYRILPQFVERLPIPDLTSDQESQLAEYAEQITHRARERYQFDESMRRRIALDLGKDGKLNEKLESWWELDFSTLRGEVKKAFKADIPLAERGEWGKYLADQTSKHAALTAQIIEHETRLNEVVYTAFKLGKDEIALIEVSTKYPYGEV